MTARDRCVPDPRRPLRAARRAALVVLCLAGAACSQERLSSSQRLSLASEPAPGGTRTVIQDDRDRTGPRMQLQAEPVVRLPWGGGALPVVSPDGRHAAVEARCTASWAERVGDPLTPAGFDAQIEAVSLEGTSPGAPTARLEGPWILGRAATDRGFLAERPRADGRRAVMIAAWDGGVEPIADDEWCNAHATAGADGTLAWSRRPPEGGDWELVVQRSGRRSTVRAPEGSSWVLPTPSGDGRGVFALRLDGASVSLAWIPFADDGLPVPGSVTGGEGPVPLTVSGGLSWALRAMAPLGGLSASPPGSDRVAFWNPDSGRAALWAPGADLETLVRGSLAATRVDAGNALVTSGEALLRHRIGAAGTDETLAAEPWFVRPVASPAVGLVGIRVRGKTAEIARLTLTATK